MKGKFLRRAMRFLPFAVLFVAVFGYVVMGLWNWLMPALFGLKSITYWQAWGLVVLSKIFFGGFRGGGGHWRHRMMERGEQMTAEEREKFRQGINRMWGHTPPPDSTPAA
jgi:hypothetical protein